MPWNVTKLQQRFDAKWRTDDGSGCWIWFGARSINGYGKISIANRLVPAHRAAWTLYRGPIPDGLSVDHLCRRRECVNPNHLELVTPAENSRRQLQARAVGRPRAEPIAKPQRGPKTLREQFDEKWRLGENGCWEWQAHKCLKGYSRIAVNGLPVPAYRVAYELYIGPIPKGLVIDHLCRNPSCVNPSHLEPVTMQENTRRGRAGEVSRARNLSKTHCKRGHPLSGDNLRSSKKQRSCKECSNLRRREERAVRGPIKPDRNGLELGASISAAARRAKTHCKRGHEFTPENTGIQSGKWRLCRKCDALRSAKSVRSDSSLFRGVP